MQSMPLRRGRGRPHKQLAEPNYDGYPVDGTGEEKQRWLKMKAAEQWRYNILTSNKAEDYREREKAHVREYNARKHEQKQPSAAAGAPPKTATSSASVDNKEKTEKLKEQSRLRYVKSSLHEIIC